MKLALEDITSVVNYLGSALTYAKRARQIAKRVHGDPKEVSWHMKIAYEEMRQAAKIMEGEEVKA